MRNIKITVTEIRVDIQERDELNIEKQNNHGQRKNLGQRVVKRIAKSFFCMLVVKGIVYIWNLLTS